MQGADDATSRASDGLGSPLFAAQTLCFAHRTGLHGMDSPVHPGQWQASLARHGRTRGGAVSVVAGSAGAGGGKHAEPGAFGTVVPLPPGIGSRLALARQRGTRQAAAKAAHGAVAR
jgi:hypothetical protein